MNYYYSEGSAGVMGPNTKTEIVELFRGNLISLEAIVCVEGTQNWMPIRSIVTSADVAARGSTQKKNSSPQEGTRPAQVKRWATAPQSMAYLEALRGNSCYSTLRSVITIATVLAFISLGLFEIGIFVTASEVSGSGTSSFFNRLCYRPTPYRFHPYYCISPSGFVVC